MVRLRSIRWYLHGGRQNVGLHVCKEMGLSLTRILRLETVLMGVRG